MKISVVFIVLLMALLVPQGAPSAEDALLERSGIRYPEGFDLNTVHEIQGKVRGFTMPEQGPVSFSLSAKRETYTVFASPRWYWDDLKVSLGEGAEVRVLGSTTLGRDGHLYLVAQELTVLDSRKSYSFRASDGTPLWKGPRIGSGGRGVGGSHQMRGGGGQGRGRR